MTPLFFVFVVAMVLMAVLSWLNYRQTSKALRAEMDRMEKAMRDAKLSRKQAENSPPRDMEDAIRLQRELNAIRSARIDNLAARRYGMLGDEPELDKRIRGEHEGKQD